MKLNLNFIDTAGQEKFLSLSKQYIRDSDIVLLVFSNLNNLVTLKNRWYNFYKDYADIEKAKFIVVGNKSDIFYEDRKEIRKLGKEFADDINNSYFLTCSAKSEDNIDNLMDYIETEAKRIIDEEEKNNKNNKSDDNSSVTNNSTQEGSIKSGKRGVKLTSKSKPKKGVNQYGRKQTN